MPGLKYKTVQKNIGCTGLQLCMHCAVLYNCRLNQLFFCTVLYGTPIQASTVLYFSTIISICRPYTLILYFLHCTLLPFPSTFVKLVHCTLGYNDFNNLVMQTL